MVKDGEIRAMDTARAVMAVDMEEGTITRITAAEQEDTTIMADTQVNTPIIRPTIMVNTTTIRVHNTIRVITTNKVTIKYNCVLVLREKRGVCLVDV